MNKHFLSAALAVFGIVASFVPMSGFAYLSPDDVFSQLAPPTQREGDEIVRQRQEEAAERRAQEQATMRPAASEPQPVDTFVPEDTSQPKGLLDENATYERRQERIANEKSAGGPTIIITGDRTVTDSNGNVLHSGAPRVTATGPESVLAFAAIILAAFSTFLYAQIRARRMIVLA